MFVFGFVHAPDKRILDRIGDLFRHRRRIRCPQCAWEPGAHDSWACAPGCHHVWNTFDTRGLCPGCSKQWTHTACLRCATWSPHDDWYEEED